MNISRPPLPLPSQGRRNNHVQKCIDKRSRQKSRKSAAKNGVSLARDHSIRFDKQYQEKHMIISSGIKLDSIKRTSSSTQLQQTIQTSQSFRVFNSKSFNALDETSTSSNLPNPNKNLVLSSRSTQKQPEIKSMTSLDMNNSRQAQRMK